MHRRLTPFSLLLTLSWLFVLLTGGVPAHAQTTAPFRVYLTFEDGPTRAYTPGILDTLAQYNARASFLIGGYQIAGNEDLIQREVREGHALVNHLWEEPGYYAGQDEAIIREQYLRTEAAIRAALGDELPRYEAQTKLFWQPGGGARPLPAIENVHVITYNWNVDSDDCGWGLPATIDLDTLAFDEAVIENILGTPVSAGQMYNAFDYGDGVIIAFHDINRVTGRVLPFVLESLRAAGAAFEALPRPWDTLDTMPVALGTPPQMGGLGYPGVTIDGHTLEDAARLRSAPGFDAATLPPLPPMSDLTAIGRAPDHWIQVRVGDSTGWVHRSLLRLPGAIPNLPLLNGG